MKTLLNLALVAGLLGVTRVPAADHPVLAVDPAQLAAFMEKWKSTSAYEYPQAPADWPLLVAALARDPQGTWPRCLDMLATDARFQLRQVKWSDRKPWAAALLSTLQQAEAITTNMPAAGVVLSNRPPAFVFAPGRYPEAKAFLALEAGQNLAALKADAQRQLAEVPDPNHWNHGQITFDANDRLGRIALREGDVIAARSHLLAAGRTSGSPTLNSFGPDFVLAHELLDHGQPADREAVLEFLEDIKRLWRDPAKRTEANSRRVAGDHLKAVETWKELIRAGKIPDDPKWR